MIEFTDRLVAFTEDEMVGVELLLGMLHGLAMDIDMGHEIDLIQLRHDVADAIVVINGAFYFRRAERKCQ